MKHRIFLGYIISSPPFLSFYLLSFQMTFQPQRWCGPNDTPISCDFAANCADGSYFNNCTVLCRGKELSCVDFLFDDSTVYCSGRLQCMGAFFDNSDVTCRNDVGHSNTDSACLEATFRDSHVNCATPYACHNSNFFRRLRHHVCKRQYPRNNGRLE